MRLKASITNSYINIKNAQNVKVGLQHDQPCHSAIIKNKIMVYTSKWMELGSIASEVPQPRWTKYSLFFGDPSSESLDVSIQPE